MREMLSVFLTVVLAGGAMGQQVFEVYLDQEHHKTFYTDSLTLKKEVNRLLIRDWYDGYLFAGTDSIEYGNDSIKVFLHRGKKYKLIADSLLVPGDNERLEKNLLSTDSKKSVDVINHVLENWINNGYPYARVALGNIRYDSLGEFFRATPEIHPGPYIVYDSIKFLSDIKTNRSFIYKVYGLVPGRRFSESDYKAIRRRTDRIPFLSLVAAPDIAFASGKARIFLRLNERAMNSFQGIVGVFPNQTVDQGLLITGSLDLKLHNLFWSGKYLAVYWQKFAEQSQALDLSYKHPFFLETSLQLEVDFNLMRQDSSFIQQNWQLGLGHFLGDRLLLTAAYNRQSGNLLTTDLEHILNENFADYHSDIYSIQLTSDFYERPFGLRSGLTFTGKISAGQKKIDRNPSLPQAFYDTLTGTTAILKINFSTKAQKMMIGRFGIHHILQLGVYQNDEPLKNELFRIGGFSTLRGFNERSFFSQNYGVSRLEFRQYFGEFSYFMVFYDQAILTDFAMADWPMGIGTGFSMTTNQGLLNFALAIGRSKQFPFDFSNTKVHIGYISRF